MSDPILERREPMTWPAAYICQFEDCKRLTVPSRTVPTMCPHCKRAAKWRRFRLTKGDKAFLQKEHILPDDVDDHLGATDTPTDDDGA